jgi:very-short-patch-repair endonuclease
LWEVYVRSDAIDTIELRASAVGLVAPPHAVICDRTAAWLWGVDMLQHWELHMLPRLDTYVLRGHTRMRRPEAAGGERDLRSEDLVRIGGLQVTTPLRTSLDLACRLGRYEGLAVMDAFARSHSVTSTELAALLPRYRGRRGVVRARSLVPLVDSQAESTGESFTRLAIYDAGLPGPELQHWVMIGGVPTYRLDLAYPRLRICVEYDGEQFHSSQEAREYDARRRAWLRGQGWVVIVVRKGDFRGPALDQWLADLRAALDERMR